MEVLRARLEGLANGYTVTNYPHLRQTWPDPQWLLAINPDQPLDAYLPIEAIESAASGELVPPTLPEVLSALDLVDLPPQNPVEEAMLKALDAQDVDAYVEALLLADVLVPTTEEVTDLAAALEEHFPWYTNGSGDSLAIAVFTSEPWLARVHAENATAVTVPFIFVLASWPDGHRLLVNPGTALSVELPGEEVSALLHWPSRDQA